MKLAYSQFHDPISHVRFRAATSEAFAAAAIELCTRIWLELERLSRPLDSKDAQPSHSCRATRFEVLRLELDIILSHCSARWTQQLDPLQRNWLNAVLEEVLVSLDVSADELPAIQSISHAQNHLLTAILEQCAAILEPLAPERSARGGPFRG
jgi:hypothetical protein